MTASLDESTLAADPDCASKPLAYIRNGEYLENVFFVDLRGKAIYDARDLRSSSGRTCRYKTGQTMKIMGRPGNLRNVEPLWWTRTARGRA